MMSNALVFCGLLILTFATKFAISVPSEAVIGDALSITNQATQAGTSNDLGATQSGLCLNEHNAARRQNGKGPLTFDSRLETAARKHNEVMTSQNCFDHQCPGEPGMGDRISSAGYRWWGLAENIAAGQRDCNSALNSWMNSAGHRKNILGDYKHVGCSFYKNHWTCDFGNPR